MQSTPLFILTYSLGQAVMGASKGVLKGSAAGSAYLSAKAMPHVFELTSILL